MNIVEMFFMLLIFLKLSLLPLNIHVDFPYMFTRTLVIKKLYLISIPVPISSPPPILF